MIYDLVEKTESDINYEYLVILDERSSKDESALVVVNRKREEEPMTFRAAFDVVNVVVMAMFGKGLSRDYKESADGAEDGILRF